MASVQSPSGEGGGDKPTTSTVITFAVLAAALTAIIGWQVGMFMSDAKRTAAENVTLKAEVEKLTKENEKLREQSHSWRPGTPIGTPIGNPAGAVGATQDTK